MKYGDRNFYGRKGRFIPIGSGGHSPELQNGIGIEVTNFILRSQPISVLLAQWLARQTSNLKAVSSSLT